MKNKFIVIEGACDGVGKTTQVKMLEEHLQKDGINVISHHFPSYNSDMGVLISNYLEGKYGNINELSPYFINSLYALDRKIVSDILKDTNAVILLDRYTTSSLIYQSALINDKTEKNNFIDYIIDYEYNKLNIKSPDEVIFLNAPFDLITKIRKERKNNEGVKQDIHENNIEFMKKVYNNALYISNYLSWNIINCNTNNKLRNKEEIHNDIYKLVKKKIDR